jgi:hypothetical protein
MLWVRYALRKQEMQDQLGVAGECQCIGAKRSASSAAVQCTDHSCVYHCTGAQVPLDGVTGLSGVGDTEVVLVSDFSVVAVVTNQL